MLALACVIGYPIYLDYVRTDAQERQRLLGQATMVEKNLTRELGAIHRALQGVRADPLYWGQTAGPGQPSPRLKTLVESMSGIRTFNILNAEGTVTASNRAELIGNNFKNRPYFETALRLSDQSALIVSSPFQTSLNVFAMNMVMMIPGKTGEFTGIVSVTLNPDFFTTLMGSVLYAPDMWSAIAHGDGLQFLMVPERPNQAGKDLRKPGSFFSRHLESGGHESVMTGIVYATGEKRMMAMVTVKPPSIPMDKPLVIAISRDVYAIYSEWMADSAKQIALYFLLLISSTVGLFVFRRRQRTFDRNLSQTALALEEARHQAEAASEAKSAFLATMSHEIRTPITSVLGMVDLLHTTGLNAEQTDYVNTLSSSAKSLLTILNDILDISKIEAGKVTLEFVKFDLYEATHAVISLSKAIADVKDVELLLDIDDDVPTQIIADQVRLKQILYNLVSNAIKFTEAGSIHLRLSTQKKDKKSAIIRCVVTDTGIGIPEHAIRYLFQPFSQVDASTTRRFGGTGLGLAIVRKLVDLAGGEIGVNSEVGRGSSFWFTLPVALPDPHEPAELRPVAAVPEPAATKGVRILLAEDNRINQMLIQSMLQKFGHSVQVVDNGRHALDAIKREKFDIVLMDMQMPEMDGEAATGAIRALPPPKNQVPVLALTADVMTEHRARYLHAGVNDLVAKPIDWHVLLEAIQVHAKKAELP